MSTNNICLTLQDHILAYSPDLHRADPCPFCLIQISLHRLTLHDSAPAVYYQQSSSDDDDDDDVGRVPNAHQSPSPSASRSLSSSRSPSPISQDSSSSHSHSYNDESSQSSSCSASLPVLTTSIVSCFSSICSSVILACISNTIASTSFIADRSIPSVLGVSCIIIYS